jgi:predicted ABC-type ATPase
MNQPKVILAVVGPNGSGKSSALYQTEFGKELIFINPDDIARNDFSSVEDEYERDRLAWHRCNELRDELISNGASFGFETVGSHQSKVELLRRAKQLGYRVGLLFVATESPDINLRRVQYRVSQGGHSVPEDKIRTRYERTLSLLTDYFDIADTASIWDNSEEANSKNPAIRYLVKKDTDGSITVFPKASEVNWVKRHLLAGYLRCYIQ